MIATGAKFPLFLETGISMKLILQDVVCNKWYGCPLAVYKSLTFKSYTLGFTLSNRITS